MAMPTKDLTNSLIKEVAVDATLPRGYVTQDIDTLFEAGIYRININMVPNQPSWMTYGTIEVIAVQEYVTQKYYPRTTTTFAMAIRSGHSSDKNWRSWIFVPIGVTPS